MKIPYEVTFLVYIIQKFCSSSPHTAKFKKKQKNIPFEFENSTGTSEHPGFFGEGIYKFHHQPHPSISSRKCSWKSLKSKASNWVDSLAIWLHFSWEKPIWEKDGKSDVGILCKQKHLYIIISSYIKLYISLCRYQSVSIYVYVNLYSNLQYINLCNPFLRHSAVVHKVHGAFSTRGRCQRRENLREKGITNESTSTMLSSVLTAKFLERPGKSSGGLKFQIPETPKLIYSIYIYIIIYYTLPETDTAPENGRLVFFWDGLCSGSKIFAS